jgi:hypothetical protein
MAERIVSPGVFTRENDLSFLTQGIGEIGAAFIGPFKQGPAFVPTIVRTQSEFEDTFGTPDGTYYTEYAVQNYLREAGQATIVRVAGIGGYQQSAPLGIFASSSAGLGEKLIGVLYSTETGYQDYGFTGTIVASNNVTDGSFLLSGSGIGWVSASILATAANDLSDVFGESPFGAKKAYTYTYFENVAAAYTGSTVDNTVITVAALPTQDYSGTTLAPAYTEATTPFVKSQLISGERYDLFQFATLGHGDVYNKKYKIGISNVKAAGEDGATDYSTFTVTVRAYSDTDKRKSVIETFNNCNLDPASPNYIARKIGDRFIEIDSDGKITENGDYSNKSKYIRVVVSEAGSFPISAAPFGHGAYTNPIEATDNAQAIKVPAVVYQTKSTGNSSSSPLYYSGFDFETEGVSMDNANYAKSIPQNAQTGSNVTFAFDSQLNYQMTGSASSDMVKRQ